MELDISSFGMGVGLVLSGWMAGLVVSYCFTLARGVGRLRP